MKDNLQDLIQHTHGLDCIDTIKINGTAKETQILAVSDDRSVVVTGTFKTPIPSFAGLFGMPNLSKLKTILSFDDYDDNAKITVNTTTTKDGSTVPAAIHFETQTGDFVNDYRLMSKEVVEDKMKSVVFKTPTWNVTFQPTVAGILRFKKQSQANIEELRFTMKTDKGSLKIYFGDPSTHSGNFIFHSQINGVLNNTWKWPVKAFQSIMDLSGDKTIRISDQGATEVEVDSGLAVYQYRLPAMVK